MSEPAKVTLSIPSIFGYEEVVVETVGTIARVNRLPFEKISKLRTAVAEACLNAIEHGNKADQSKEVFITITCEPSVMKVSIRDFGSGLEKQPDFSMPDLKKQIEAKNLGGWGLYLMRTLVDETDVTTEPGDGTVTTLTIRG